MREIPVELQALLEEQQAIDPVFVIEINWGGVEAIKYSTKEFPSVYKYVKEFSGFESVSNVAGLGAVSSISVEFYDQFGHFKEKIDTVDFFDQTTATVYLTVDGVTFFDLFEGKIQDGAEWSNHIFSIEVASDRIEKEVGYRPSIDDVPEEHPLRGYYERHLNTKADWPLIFNDITQYEAVLVASQRQCETQEDMYYSSDGFFTIPVDQIDDYDIGTTYRVILSGKDRGPFYLVGDAEFLYIEVEEEMVPHIKISVPLSSEYYQDIRCTVQAASGITDSIPNDNNVKLKLYPGSYNIIDHEGNVLGTQESLGPDRLPAPAPWIQYMVCKLQYQYTVGDPPTSFVTRTANIRCVKQDGDICYFNRPWNFPNEYYNMHISAAGRAFDAVNKLPKGTKVYILGDVLRYVVDAKTGSTVQGIGVHDADELVEFPAELYTVKTDSLFNHPPMTYVELSAETYMRFTENLDTESGEGLLTRVTNGLQTDQDVIAYLTGSPVADSNPKTVHFPLLGKESVENIVPEIAWQTNKGVRRYRLEGEDAYELVDLTNRGEPVYAFTDDNVLRDSIVYGFTDSSALKTIFEADFEGWILLNDLESLRYEKNVDKYGERPHKVDYYVFKYKSDAEASLQWWRDKLSQVYYTIKFKGFLGAFGVEVWDRVSIDFGDSNFYDPAKGSPLTNTHEATPIGWRAEGRVTHIEPDFDAGLISFEVELDTILGDTPRQSNFRIT